jgi:regulator of protease activity HflC (stomatin/prohibitin superfamily)
MTTFISVNLFAILLVFGAVAVIVFIYTAYHIVRQGENWTVETLGRYTRTLKPGFNVIIPGIEKIGRMVSMKEQFLDIPRQEVITRDNAPVTVDAVAFYQVIDASKASYGVVDLENSIKMLKVTNMRAVIGSMDLDQVLSHRDDINARLMAIVGAAVVPWGVKITRVEIRDIFAKEQMKEVMERQMTAERQKRADILQAEGDKQAAILRAEGQREAAFKRAEGREREAQAEAKATTMVSDAVAQGDPAALNYFVAQQYLQALGKLAESPNEKLLILPLEVTSVLGSLAGIAEIAKRTFGDNGKALGSPMTKEQLERYGQTLLPSAAE